MDNSQNYLSRLERLFPAPPPPPGPEWLAARRVYADRNYLECLRLIDDVLARETGETPAEVLRWRGFVLLALGRPEEALADLRRVLELDAQSAAGYLEFATALLLDHRIQPALDQLAAGIARLPQRQAAPLYLLRGRLAAAHDDHLLAIDDFSYVIAYDCNQVEAYYRRAWARLALGEYHHALRDCREAVRLAPDDALALFTYARILCQTGNCREAVKVLAQVIELRPEARGPVALLGQALVQLEQYDYAFVFLEKAVERGCDDAATLAARDQARQDRQRTPDSHSPAPEAGPTEPDYEQLIKVLMAGKRPVTKSPVSRATFFNRLSGGGFGTGGLRTGIIGRKEEDLFPEE